MRRILNSAKGALGLAALVAFMLILASIFGSASRPSREVAEQPLEPTVTPTVTVVIEPTATPTVAVVIEPTATSTIPVGVENITVELSYLDEGYCALAPDGDRYFCRRYSPQDRHNLYWLGSLSGGQERLLVEESVVGVMWSPDGKQIVYALAAGGVGAERSLYILNVDNGEKTQLGMAKPGRIQFLMGGEIAFSTGERLHLLDPVTKAEREVEVAGLSLGPEDWPYYCEFRVSPNGQKVAVLKGRSYEGTLSIIDLDTQRAITITDQVGSSWRPMAWSPDSSRLAYGIAPDPLEIPELWVVNADGSEPRRLWTEESEEYPHRGSYEFLEWLPYQNAILFAYRPRGTNPSGRAVYQVISADGGDAKALFTNGEGLWLADREGRKFDFFREFTDDPADKGTWIASLSH